MLFRSLSRPEAAQQDQFGRMLPAACPNQPAFRDFMRGWIDQAVDLGPDMLFWDEPHLVLGEIYLHLALRSESPSWSVVVKRPPMTVSSPS